MMFECQYDTDGDGDCHRCVRRGGCLERPLEVRIVDAVLEELWGRAGFDEFWGEIQADVQREIRGTLEDKVRTLLGTV
jgi:hypothetical protein